MQTMRMWLVLESSLEGAALHCAAATMTRMPSVTLPPFVEDLGHGVFCIDTGFVREKFDAAYLMVHEGRAAFIDTGTHFAVPRLLAALEALGIARDAVAWVIPTHVHLDHAGGAGALMQELPLATLFVHPRGARHMVDPRALWQGATAVYGEAEMQRSYGAVVPVPEARVQTSHDEQVITLAGRPLRVIDSPGHARHHHCVWDAASRGWFAGDCFGIHYPELADSHGGWILPTTTPVQFEPTVLDATIARLLATEPACMYITHYGRVSGVPRLGRILREVLAESARVAQSLRDHPDRHAALKAALLAVYSNSAARHGSPHTHEALAQLLAVDIELNAQGSAVWLDKATH
jgi:glyoxylase-like metal-dependent hydrolase (beta-lactamase superfamily II)